MVSYKMIKMNGLPYQGREAKLVCTRCNLVMKDYEPSAPCGEFFHKPKLDSACVNDNKTFYLTPDTQEPEDKKETSLFESKKTRRLEKAANKRARKFKG